MSESESQQICGVLVTDKGEFPCVLPKDHEGFCDYGQEAATEDTSDRDAEMFATMPLPALGRMVYYRSKTGAYTCPAEIVAVQDSLHQPNVDAGHVPPLSGARSVHLVVSTPGKSGHVSDDTRENHPDLVADDRPNKPFGGTYQEFDIPQWAPIGIAFARWQNGDYSVQDPGTWAWPFRK